MKYQAQPPPAQPHLHLLHQLLAQGYPHQVLINAQTPLTLKIPALIACNLYDDAISEILGQDLKDDEEICQLHLVWLSICCYMVNTEYSEYLDQLEKEGQDPRYAELVKQWIRQYKPVIHPQQIKISIRKKFEQLLLQAQQQNYYSLQRMPVYLLPTSWLQKFYSQSLQQIPSIDTTCLSTSSAYIEASPLHHHYNYNIKEQCKQNIDYKIISYEAWHYLFSIFGGTQFKRFNTNQKQAVCEIRYQKMKVVVVEERWLFGLRVFQIFVARFDTVESVIERVKNIMGDYAIADADSLALDWVPLLVSKMEVADLFNIIQDESRNLIKQASPKTHQIIQLLPTSDIQDIEYNQQKDILLLTLCQKQSPQWLDIRSLKKKPSTKKYPKCLTCSTAQPSLLQDCICKQAYFCSKQCRNKNKDHLKICQTLMKEETILNRLVDGFAIQKRKMKWLYVKKGGKVGLENLGNTCYMNAALQCVLSVEGLNAYFLGNRHLHELNVINVLGSGGELACAYGEFVKDYYTTTRRALEPIRILKIISSKNTQFRGHNHQDSQEFFNYFFDKLHQDLNRVREKPYIQNIQSDGRPDDVVSELSWSNYLKRNSSFISDNFAGQYRSEIKCPDCSRVSITFDPFLSVTLPFPKQEIHEQLVGYFLSKQGQFQKVQKKVKPSMPAQQFLQKFFNQPVHPLWLQKKQPLMQWKLKKSISSNNPGKGVLIFYEKPTNSTVQLQIKIEGYDIFHRKVFTPALKQISDLKRQVYSSIKVPLLKATRKEEFIGIGLEEYINRAVESQFIEIVEHSIKEFPFVQGVANLKIKIIQEKCPFPTIQKIKFDFSSRPYTAKIDFPVYRSLTDSITLTQLLRSFSQPEQLTQDNSWYCNKCKGHKLAQKKMSLYNSAKYLVVHLKRFNHKGNRYVIYGEKVRMPVKLENIEIICGKKYKLFGVVNHYGSLSMGHYTAYVNREGEWYYADDSSFRKRDVDGSDAYLLFYQCIEVEND